MDTSERIRQIRQERKDKVEANKEARRQTVEANKEARKQKAEAKADAIKQRVAARQTQLSLADVALDRLRRIPLDLDAFKQHLQEENNVQRKKARAEDTADNVSLHRNGVDTNERLSERQQDEHKRFYTGSAQYIPAGQSGNTRSQVKPPIKSKLDEIAVERGCYFDDELAHYVKEFIETYAIQSKHPWSGKPLELTPWQWEEWILPFYSWKKADGTLRHNRVLAYLPKKCGKTALTAALGVYHLQEYPGSQCALIASSIKQAGNLFSNCCDYIELSPLGNKIKTHNHNKTITYDAERSNLEVLSSNPTVSGGSYNFLAWDEIVEFAPATARIVWDRLKNSNAARTNSAQVIISTANYANAEHIGVQLYRYAQDLLSGKNDKDIQTLAIVKQVPLEANWREPASWYKHLPIGLTVSKQYYQDEYDKAKGNPQDELAFRTFLLNQFVQSNQNAWIESSQWEACQKDFDDSDLIGYGGVVAIDTARKYDLSGYVIAIEKQGVIHLLARAFIPAQIAEKKEKTDSVPYRMWADQGYVTLTAGDVIDPRTVREYLVADYERFNLSRCIYDPYNFEETRQLLEDSGLDCVEFPQVYTSFSPVLAHFERAIIARKIAHNGNPCLSWCIGNAQIKRDNRGQIMLDKIKSNQRIDLAVCAAMSMQPYLVTAKDEWDGPLCGLM